MFHQLYKSKIILIYLILSRKRRFLIEEWIQVEMATKCPYGSRGLGSLEYDVNETIGILTRLFQLGMKNDQEPMSLEIPMKRGQGIQLTCIFQCGNKNGRVGMFHRWFYLENEKDGFFRDICWGKLTKLAKHS